MYKKDQKRKRKTILFVVGLVLLLGGVVVGTYFILQKYVTNKISMDKHNDILSLCSNKENTNVYKCDLLLIDIIPNQNGKSCFNVQIISNNTLVPTSFCEEEKYLTLTNEVVQFKKLKPLTVAFTYEANKLTNISFVPLDSKYVQDLVNEDINSLLTHKKEDPLIYRNSFDFCPKPLLLPNYVEKKNEYTNVYTNQILKANEYNDSQFNYFLPCYTAKKHGYNNLCGNGLESEKNKVKEILTNLYKNIENIKFNDGLSGDDQSTVNMMNYLYDNLFSKVNKGDIVKSAQDIKKMVNSTYDDIDSFPFCALGYIYKAINADEKMYENLKIIINNNLDKEIPASCYTLVENSVDKTGFYIKQHYTNTKETKLLNKCINLNMLFE